MVTLYFIRHAESTANADHILASRMPYPLSSKGKTDAVQLARDFKKTILKDKNLDKIISSSLVRARQTAQPFSELLDISVEEENRIVEQDMGMFAGMTYAELDDQLTYVHEKALRWDWNPEGGGESYRQIAGRVTDFFQSLTDQYAENIPDKEDEIRILCITHGVTLRIIWAVLQDMLPKYPTWLAKNGEVWEVSFQGLGEVHSITRHFPEGSSKVLHQE